MKINVKHEAFDQNIVDGLSKQLNFSKPFVRILLSRGLRDEKQIREFLSPAPEGLHDAFAFRDMAKAVSRIRRAIVQQEKILVCGDRDVDGVSAVAIMTTVLADLGAGHCPVGAFEVFTSIPDSEGYGLHTRIITEYAKQGVTLLISVDCGITECEPVIAANAAGIDCIITDHHEPSENIPPALALLCTKQNGETYPDRNLCGAAIAFKLAQALIRKETDAVSTEQLPARTEFITAIHQQRHQVVQDRINDLLLLAGLATIADVVPLLGENRIIARYCLDHILEIKRPGLRLLIEKALRGKNRISTTDIAFRVTPVLNSPGRLEQSRITLNLYSEDPAIAEPAFKEIIKLDTQRRTLTTDNHKVVRELLVQQVDLEKDSVFIIVVKEMQHGVTGIIANRILDEFSKPVIILIDDGEVIQGAGRSPAGINLLEIVESCAEHLIKFGGHNQAIGLQVKRERLAEFIAAVKQRASRVDISETCINTDMEISAPEITLEFVNEISTLEPFGSANREPLFLMKNFQVSESRAVGKTGDHLRLRVEHDSYSLDMVYFGGVNRYEELRKNTDRFDAAIRLEADEFRGIRRVSTVIEELTGAKFL